MPGVDRRGLDEVPQIARVKWWCDRCRAQGWKPAPILHIPVGDRLCLLIKGQYRAVDSYISTTKRMHILAGDKWTDQHILVARDSLRVAKRGQGPAKQEQPLPSEEIVSLTATVAPRPRMAFGASSHPCRRVCMACSGDRVGRGHGAAR